GSIQSTKTIVQDIQSHFSSLNLLINNAGVWPTKLSLNPDGLEMGFMVNHLAPLILSHGLRSQLEAGAPARIVNVNAGLYVKGKVDLDATPYGQDFHKIKTYANTKLCNMLMSLELAERLPANKITVNALHPGVIRTDLGDFSGPLGWILKFVKHFWATPSKGAEAPVWLATNPELEGISGKYFNEKEEMELSVLAKNAALRKALWGRSLALASISWED
nr:SDR family NAD(P)-dependent oxidoreductase [Saprospiraceae bacterium]